MGLAHAARLVAHEPVPPVVVVVVACGHDATAPSSPAAPHADVGSADDQTQPKVGAARRKGGACRAQATLETAAPKRALLIRDVLWGPLGSLSYEYLRACICGRS